MELLKCYLEEITLHQMAFIEPLTVYKAFLHALPNSLIAVIRDGVSGVIFLFFAFYAS